jgi:hypothetical protein
MRENNKVEWRFGHQKTKQSEGRGKEELAITRGKEEEKPKHWGRKWFEGAEDITRTNKQPS